MVFFWNIYQNQMKNYIDLLRQLAESSLQLHLKRFT